MIINIMITASHMFPFGPSLFHFFCLVPSGGGDWALVASHAQREIRVNARRGSQIDREIRGRAIRARGDEEG